MADRDRVIEFLNQTLGAGSISDYAPQGLQVEGRAEVRRVAVGVTASVELFRRAVDEGADLLLVHHGMFWDSDPRVVKGGLRERLRILIEHEVTLLGYHLVLDAHDEHGNNAIIARELELTDVEPFGEYNGVKIGRKGRFPEPISRADFLKKAAAVFGAEPLAFPFGPDPMETVGVVSGGAVREFQQALDEGLDAFITGEVQEFVQERVREESLTYVSAGHYRSETFGVRSLGALLEKEFGLPWSFIDVPNPV
ncbi:MAG: Nif3-like dinuclear metal center hexameric protein [Gemmatimonadota bacterium]|nr:Nif3-like dinuclear metal center hexameric protein [Gemmatimonadota bacterium]MDP6461975.1 Nif3-like dinuclear metal center hexameric protein [Gemmatimonadota bacterium]MDP6528197.1 Nif3-like dinuclear metal center hexameric protein [Gemmatimonadota bacterium]MDP6802004.1 Nif3-like dinuclear metal center hexameric protein [Gemmatimonadota bacterium]MDP7031352.1 Nif3-like dinuclear metal center hexameric protein [Gemmatimonadota bacterium]